MMRCHSVSVRRSCGALDDAVVVGDVDMGLMVTLEGLSQPPQSGRQALEIELQSQLDDARLVRGQHFSEIFAGGIQVEVFKVGLVEDVETFKPELHAITFREFEVLEE